MNIAVSFSLRFAENMLNMSLGSFQNALSSTYRVIAFYIIFQLFFLPPYDLFTLIKICSICLVLKTILKMLLLIVQILENISLNEFCSDLYVKMNLFLGNCS